MTSLNEPCAAIAEAAAEENDASANDGLHKPLSTSSSRRRRSVTATEYASYIRSDAWRTAPARLAELLASGGRCRICNAGSTAAILTVHHRCYDRLGCELADDLTTLCGECHDGVTDMLRRRSNTSRALPAPLDLPKPSIERLLVDSSTVTL